MNPSAALTLATSLTGSPAVPESAVWLVWGNRERQKRYVYKNNTFINWHLSLINAAAFYTMDLIQNTTVFCDC